MRTVTKGFGALERKKKRNFKASFTTLQDCYTAGIQNVVNYPKNIKKKKVQLQKALKHQLKISKFFKKSECFVHIFANKTTRILHAGNLQSDYIVCIEMVLNCRNRQKKNHNLPFLISK